MSEPPEFYRRAKQQHPELFKSYESLSQAAKEVGPLDNKSATLVKLAMAIGSGLEGATHSGVRKALEAGWTADELRHAVLLGVTTLGFPTTMRARAWVEDVLAP
jgi:4-carboxymuconolactone decarboxylase